MAQEPATGDFDRTHQLQSAGGFLPFDRQAAFESLVKKGHGIGAREKAGNQGHQEAAQTGMGFPVEGGHEGFGFWSRTFRKRSGCKGSKALVAQAAHSGNRFQKGVQGGTGVGNEASLPEGNFPLQGLVHRLQKPSFPA